MSSIKNINCENCAGREKGIFCELEKVALEGVSHAKITNTYKRGQVIFFQGNPPFGLYCINSGKVKLSRVGDDGKESIVRIAASGDVLGHRSLFSTENYTATATVLEDAAICFIDKKYIYKTIQDEPTVALSLIQKLSKEMGAAESRSASIAQKSVRERLAEFFIMMVKSYGILENDRYRLDIKLTREEIASIIGTASETVIRFITEFKDEGLIEQEGKTLFVIDLKTLEEMAGLSI